MNVNGSCDGVSTAAGAGAAVSLPAHLAGPLRRDPVGEGQERRDDVVGARSATAWGSPAIIARCGLAPQPPSADQCIDVSGTDWVVQPLTDGTRLTSYGTDPAIEVLVPERYAPAPLRVGVFADAVRSLPSTGRRCT